MRRARELALAGLLLAACFGTEGPCPPTGACAGTMPPGVTASGEREIAFRDDGATASSEHRGPAAIEAVRSGNVLRITAYQGEQRTGGYSIRIERITRIGVELRVHAAFITPVPDAIVTQVLTSPSHTVIVDESASVVVLYDLTGAERARTAPR